VRALAVTLRGAALEAWSNRASFWTQLLAMAANDVVWVLFWLIFFDRVGELRGWDADSVLLLFAALTAVGGIVLGPLSNSRRVGAMAADGDLDAALTLPVPTLPYLLVRRLDAANLGDLVFGVVLFLVAGDPTPGRAAVFVLVVLAAAAVLVGFLVAAGSVAFYTGRGEVGDLGLHGVILLASYPADIFTGATRALLHVAVPAAFVATVPARLVEDFGPGQFAGLAAAAAGFLLLGWATFTAGLRRYASGSVWTRA
jgi:ABC-2 type transport system permease protein